MSRWSFGVLPALSRLCYHAGRTEWEGPAARQPGVELRVPDRPRRLRLGRRPWAPGPRWPETFQLAGEELWSNRHLLGRSEGVPKARGHGPLHYRRLAALAPACGRIRCGGSRSRSRSPPERCQTSKHWVDVSAGPPPRHHRHHHRCCGRRPSLGVEVAASALPAPSPSNPTPPSPPPPKEHHSLHHTPSAHPLAPPTPRTLQIPVEPRATPPAAAAAPPPAPVALGTAGDRKKSPCQSPLWRPQSFIRRCRGYCQCRDSKDF